MIKAQDALLRLKEGNSRFTNDELRKHNPADPAFRQDLVREQKPFAVVLGCSDSRVPVELIFDQGLGDLFVVRIAGNIATPTEIGSVEYAAEVLGTRLVLVLGHTGCGAVQSTLQAIEQGSPIPSPNLSVIVNTIRPAIESLTHTPRIEDRQSLMKDAVRANVRATVASLETNSALLSELVQGDGLRIVGAEYSLETGAVEFL